MPQVPRQKVLAPVHDGNRDMQGIGRRRPWDRPGATNPLASCDLFRAAAPGNPLVRFDEGRVGRAFRVALSPTLPRYAFGIAIQTDSRKDAKAQRRMGLRLSAAYCTTASTGCGASTLCLQSAFGHCQNTPAFSLFSTMYGLPHSVHFSGTGLPQATKVQSG